MFSRQSFRQHEFVSSKPIIHRFSKFFLGVKKYYWNAHLFKFKLNETTENGIVPVVGTTYTSTFNNYFMFLQIADKDWIECEWATLPASSTAARNFKCVNDFASIALLVHQFSPFTNSFSFQCVATSLQLHRMGPFSLPLEISQRTNWNDVISPFSHLLCIEWKYSVRPSTSLVLTVLS